jgi:hypothetical protein
MRKLKLLRGDLYLVAAIALLICIALFNFTRFHRAYYRIKKNEAKIKAVVTDKNNNRTRKGLDFKFYIKDKQYEGLAFSPHLNKLDIGDTIVVYYNKLDPTDCLYEGDYYERCFICW